MQEMNRVGTPLELDCQEISQGLIVPCERQAQGRAPVCRDSHVSSS